MNKLDKENTIVAQIAKKTKENNDESLAKID